MNPRSHQAMPLHEAMTRSQPLERLQSLIRESNARLDAIRDVLPAALLDQVRPGPVDATGWTMLVRNGATGAKLRQWQPALEQALQAKGWEISAIRIRVQA